MELCTPVSPCPLSRDRAFGAGQVLAALAVLLPPLAVFVPLGLAPLLGVTALALLVADGRRCIAALHGLTTIAALLAALSLWAMLSAAWSTVPQHSLLEGIRFLAISAGGLIALAAGTALEPAERARVGKTAMLGVALAVGFLLVERTSGAAITRLALGMDGAKPLALTRFDRGATTIVLALWPALAGAAAARCRLLAIGLALVVPATTVLMLSTTAALAAPLALAAGAAAWLAPRLVAAGVAAGVLLLAFALPVTTPDYRTVVAIHQNAPWLKESAVHRLAIWRFTADRIAERPLLGWGMDASRELPGGKVDLARQLPQAGLVPGAHALPLHPHDAALQWRVELGLPGLLLCLAVVGWALWRIGWQTSIGRERRATALGYAAAALVIGMLSYGVWQAWWQACLWLTVALLAGAGGAPARDGR